MQPLNLIPYPAIIVNCLGRVAYSYVIVNYYMLTAGSVGAIAGLFYTMTCSGLAPQRTLDIMAGMLVVLTTAMIVVGAVGSFRHLARAEQRLLWGYASNVLLMAYYASPLSTIWTVLHTRCAASLSVPMAAMNALNGGLWLAYGLAIHDPFIWVTNGVGLGIAIILLSCIIMFKNGQAEAGLAPAMYAWVGGGFGLTPVDPNKPLVPCLAVRTRARAPACGCLVLKTHPFPLITPHTPSSTCRNSSPSRQSNSFSMLGQRKEDGVEVGQREPDRTPCPSTGERMPERYSPYWHMAGASSKLT